MPTSMRTLHVEMIRLHASMEPLDQVLDPIGAAIRAAGERAERLDLDSAFDDVVLQDECDLVENLLGASFIACQSFVTGVVSSAKKLREFGVNRSDGVRLVGELR